LYQAILSAADILDEDAQSIAEILVDAELRGHADHGAILLGLYLIFPAWWATQPPTARACRVGNLRRIAP
jgi:hypothetical protein